MTTHPVYDRILSQITDDTVRDVYCVIRDSHGKAHAISKEAISLVIWQKYTQTTDRTVRECVEILHETYGVPVCSNSGKAGRYLPASRAELDEFIAEHESRAKKEFDAAEKLKKAAKTWDFTKPKEHIPASFEAVQSTLFDLPAAHREGAYV